MTYNATLNAIRECGPCKGSWAQLLESLGKTKADDTEVSLTYILDLLGLDDALWALRALPDDYDAAVRLLVCDLVEPALQYADDPRPAKAVQMSRGFVFGSVSRDELDAARDAAQAAAWAGAQAAAQAAALAAARDAAQAAAQAAALAAAQAAALAGARAAALAGALAAALAAAWAAARAEQETILRTWLEGES